VNALLTELHPTVPAGVDPLLELPAGVNQQSFSEQLQALQEVYEDDVMRGLGLILIIMQSAESRWQWRLREATELWVRQLGHEREFESLVLRHLDDYLTREKQLVWALRALDIPSDMGLDYLRAQGSKAYDFGGCGPGILTPDQTEWPEVIPDLLYEQELAERHGRCPKWFDPSHQGIVEPAGLAPEARMELLASIYGPAIDRATALEEMLARVDSIRSRVLIDELRAKRAEGAPVSELLRQEMAEVIELEGHCYWTACYLGLTPGQALRQISEQLG
jgi:hypothetical protein